MRGDHERRIAALEAQARGDAVEFWVNAHDGFMRRGLPPDEIVITRAEFETRYPDAQTFTIRLSNLSARDLLDDGCIDALTVNTGEPPVDSG